MAKIYTVVATLLEVCTSALNKQVAELRDTILGIQADNLSPHGGADPRGIFHHVVQKMVEALVFGANKQVVETLFPTSERLRELRNEFSPMVRERKWIVCCFQEQYGVPALQGRKASQRPFNRIL